MSDDEVSQKMDKFRSKMDKFRSKTEKVRYRYHSKICDLLIEAHKEIGEHIECDKSERCEHTIHYRLMHETIMNIFCYAIQSHIVLCGTNDIQWLNNYLGYTRRQVEHRLEIIFNDLKKEIDNDTRTSAGH